MLAPSLSPGLGRRARSHAKRVASDLQALLPTLQAQMTVQLRQLEKELRPAAAEDTPSTASLQEIARFMTPMRGPGASASFMDVLDSGRT